MDAVTDAEDVSARLEKLFGAILAHAKANPEFAQELDQALAGEVVAAAPPPPKRNPAELDPFKVYEQGWESMLRQRLTRLDDEKLRDVIHKYGLDERGKTGKLKDEDKLREWIVKAILEKQKSL